MVYLKINQIMINLEQDRIDKINEWMETVLSIDSENISTHIKEDDLTIMDRDYYDIVLYTDNTGRGEKTRSSKPSIILKMFNQVLRENSFIYSGYTAGRYITFRYHIDLDYIFISLNSFYNELVNIESGYYNNVDRKSSRFKLSDQSNMKIDNIGEVKIVVDDMISVLAKGGSSITF
jgi:hypothetical protein